MSTVPEWYWKSEKAKKIVRDNNEFLSKYPCQCRNEEYAMNAFSCICVDGECPTDFCTEHGGYNPEHSLCLCCDQLPMPIV